MTDLRISVEPYLSLGVRSALFLAAEEARQANQGHVGTGHVLCGLTRERESAAGQAIASLGLSIDTIRGLLADIAGPSRRPTTPEALGFSPRAEKLIEQSLRSAAADGRATIETHDILGSLREIGEGTAVSVLERAGVGAAELEKAIEEQLDGADESGGT